MPPTRQELSLLINPVVPDAVLHNKGVSRFPTLSSIRQQPLLYDFVNFLPDPPIIRPARSVPKKLTIPQTLSSIHSLAAFLLGISAGILGLQSSHGFLFYFLGTLFVSLLFHAVLVGFNASDGAAGATGGGGSGGADRYFPGTGEIVEGGRRKGAWRDVWFAGGVVGEGVSGFVLGWAGVGGFLR